MKIIINGFGYVDVGDRNSFLLQIARYSVCRRSGIVAAYTDQQFYVIFQKKFGVQLFVLWLEPAHDQSRAAPAEYAVGMEKIEFLDLRVFTEYSLKPLVQPQYPVAIL